MSKTGHEWLAELPLHIQDQIEDNLYDGTDILDDTLSSLSGFIHNLFSWCDTNEGDAYWMMIHDMAQEDQLNFEKLYKHFPEFAPKDEIINNYQIY